MRSSPAVAIIFVQYRIHVYFGQAFRRAQCRNTRRSTFQSHTISPLLTPKYLAYKVSILWTLDFFAKKHIYMPKANTYSDTITKGHNREVPPHLRNEIRFIGKNISKFASLQIPFFLFSLIICNPQLE